MYNAFKLIDNVNNQLKSFANSLIKQFNYNFRGELK